MIFITYYVLEPVRLSFSLTMVMTEYSESLCLLIWLQGKARHIEEVRLLLPGYFDKQGVHIPRRRRATKSSAPPFDNADFPDIIIPSKY